MADHGYLFSAPMILALKREVENPGTGKTVTRRLPNTSNVTIDGRRIGANPEVGKGVRWLFDALDWDKAWVDPGGSLWGPGPYWHVPCVHPRAGGTTHRIKPIVRPGDRLWVRENFYVCPKCAYISYAADINRPNNCTACDEYLEKMTPSIHLPRSASRFALLEPSIKLQRLQEITPEEAVAEGLARLSKDGDGWRYGLADAYGRATMSDGGWFWDEWLASPVEAYARLWNKLHGAGAWEKNPWILATSFKPVKGNIDELGKAA